MGYPSFNPDPGSRHSRVPEALIVEDYEALREVVVRMVRVSGCKVYSCGDGLEAIKLIGKKPFDLVITDLMMPGADGMEVFRATRKSQPHALVIIVTGTPSSRTLLEAKSGGAYAYLNKPFELDNFQSILQEAVTHIRLREDCQPLARKDLLKGDPFTNPIQV